MDDRVRHVVYDVTMREGAPPASHRIEEILEISAGDVRESLRRLADAHMLVLRDDGEILMAGPFSAVPTPFQVSVAGISCYANCIWDALGIPVMLHSNALIDTTCAYSSTPVQLRVIDGSLDGDGFMHFVVPARLWWLHIIYT